MSEEIRNILINKDLIAVNQDPLGKQGFKIYDEGNFEIWQKPLSGNDIVICLLNLENKDKDFSINWSKIKIRDFSGSYEVKDLWENNFIGNTKEAYSFKIPARDVLIFRLHKI